MQLRTFFFRWVCALVLVTCFLGFNLFFKSEKNIEDRWFWAGQPLKKVHTAYVYQGLFRNQKFYDRRPFSKKVDAKRVWLTFRYDKMSEIEPSMFVVKYRIYRWLQVSGNQIFGIQIDYDCPTSKLGSYAKVLARFKKNLGGDLHLGITGLGD